MTSHPITLTDRIRGITRRFMERLGLAVHTLGIHPDAITIAGTIGVLLAAIPISQQEYALGGLILLLALPLDALDGAVARAMQRQGRFGGVLDSSLDRYADGIIFGALAYSFALRDEFVFLLLAMAALNGSFVVSYVRARAGEAGLSVKVGWFSRLERVVVLLVMLFVPVLMVPGLAVLAAGTNISAFQRLWYVRRHLDQE